VAEARRLEIPLVALLDTNCNPGEVDYPIPANDDAIRAVKLLSGKIADAIVEGTQMRKAADESEQEKIASEAAEAAAAVEKAEGEGDEKPEIAYSASPEDAVFTQAEEAEAAPTGAPS